VPTPGEVVELTEGDLVVLFFIFHQADRARRSAQT
jgi:hypothetical protein